MSEPMTNEERIKKLERAVELIREVEFSWPPGHQMRLGMFRVVVDTFGYGGNMHQIINDLKDEIKLANRSRWEDEEDEK
jgi:hypothetical protein